MTDGVVFLLTAIPQAGEYLRSGIIPQRGEMMLSGNEPYCAVYETKDNKYITVSPLEPHFWQNMCHALEREDLAPHQFAPSPKKEEIFNELKQNFQTRTRDEWFELLTKADVPVGKVLDLEEVFTDPHVLHRQMVLEIDDPELGRVKEIGFSIKLSDTPGQVRTLAPRLGQHTDEILSDLGYSQVEIENLHSERIIHS
jgi:crotonobetainyl-CoA:carnitine CoA-transferase CaiB-like acyl-CoA transferase